MNWVILLGLLITGLLQRKLPRLAAWLGLALTLAILVWGLVIYGQADSAVSFFGLPLSRMAFMGVMGLFLGLSLAQLARAYRSQSVVR